jgi:hypothetical protein
MCELGQRSYESMLRPAAVQTRPYCKRMAVDATKDGPISETLGVVVADHSSKRVPTVFGMNASPKRAPMAC